MPIEDGLLRFVHISDTHINPDTSYNEHYAQHTPLIGAQALVDAVNALPFQPDFILHTGDVAYNPVPAVYDAVRHLLGQLKAPIYYVRGNHDDHEALQALAGRSPADIRPYFYYEFESKGVQVVCLDSNGPHVPENPSGCVTPEQMEWLNAVCTGSDERPLMVAIHHNPVAAGVPWLDDWMRIENGDDLHRVLRKASHRLRGVFYGHIHQNIDIYQDGVLYASAASSWCQFTSHPIPTDTIITPDRRALPGFNVVSMTSSRTAIRRHTFEPPVSQSAG